MKKTTSKIVAIIIVIIIACVLILGCSKDETLAKTPQDLIIGKWINPVDSSFFTFKVDSKLIVKWKNEHSSTNGIYYFTTDEYHANTILHIWTGSSEAQQKYIDLPANFPDNRVLSLGNDSIIFYKK